MTPETTMQFPVTIDMFQTVVGVVLPTIIAVVVKSHYTSRVKALISVACVIVVSFLHLFFMGEFSFGDLSGSILKIGYISVTMYFGFFKPVGITDWIETKVNP